MRFVDELGALMAGARWFGGRGRGASVVSVDEVGPVGDVLSLLARVAYDDGSSELYHVPILASATPEFVEAPDEPLALWDVVASAGDDFRLLSSLPRPAAARRFRGEQSNTNVFFDNGTLLKVLRRVEDGGDIEAELLEALRGSDVAPELHGVWKHGDLALGVLVEALPDPADGYDLAVEHATAGSSFADHARALGEGLATMHRTLATRLGTGEVDQRRVTEAFRARFEDAAGSVEALAEYREGILRVFDGASGLPVRTHRVHGDCHLGQTLRSGGRWRYVDFEGEPMKSVPERRRADSPLRDVAGMLRSFEYAAAAGGALPEWLEDAREAFLEGYGIDPGGGDPLLAAYELDKAIYEAVYEARFRPSLLHVPIAGIRRLASAS